MPEYVPLPAEAASAAPATPAVTPADMPAVIERLLIAGLREQDLADELRRQLAFTTAVNSSLAEGIYALDMAGRINFVNPAAERLLGWPAAEVLGTDAHTLLHLHCTADQGGNTERCPLLEVTRTGMAYRNGEGAFRRKDGTVLSVGYSAAPILLDGAVSGSVVVFSDETARHRMEQQREAFLEAVTHDMGSPITVIKGTAQLLQKRVGQGSLPEDADLRRQLARIEATATRMNVLISDVLDVSRLRMGQQLDLKRRVTDLVLLARQAATELQGSLDEQRIEVTSEVPTLTGLWDAARLERVVINLLSNAVKYGRAGGDVDVKLARRKIADRPWAVLTVVDHGIGIPSADLPHIFERFHRGRNVIGSIPGTGIGLHGARQIVEQHGGVMLIESREGQGTTVTVRLPLS